MDILGKFEGVEIKNDTRLPAEDLEYCKQNQELYLKVIDHHKEIFEEMTRIYMREEDFFEGIKEENTYERGESRKYYYCFSTKDRGRFTTVIMDVHRRFVNIIYDYFAGKYGIKLDKKSAEDILCLKSFGEYGKEIDKYREDIITARVDFNDIVADIFIQLDGCSFVEKAKNEIVDACKNACYNGYRNIDYAELKKCKITINTGFRSYFNTIWKEYEAGTDNETFRAIIRALSFFDSDEKEKKIYPDWRNEFIFYNRYERDGIYGFHSVQANKVQSLRFYKNGKWEIHFNSQEYAEKFFNEYFKH